MKSIFIFRRDLRTFDNIGYINCLKNSSTIYPIFIFTPEQIKSNSFKSSNAVQFMIESLKDLSSNTSLSLFFGENNNVIQEIINKEKIDAIFTNEDYTPYARKRDNDLQKLCDKNNIKLFLSRDYLLYEPGTILTKSGKPYQKYTPFYRNVLPLKVDKPLKIPKKKTKLCKNKFSISFNDTNKYYVFNDKLNVNGGRKLGKTILNNIKNFTKYGQTRDLLPQKTTHLSAYIKFGCLSIREVYHKIKKKMGIQHPLIRQLIWREFYYHLGDAFPKVIGNPLKDNYKGIKWSNNNNTFEAWKKGMTGYPVVDAGMRQLNTIGYMHNRTRLITASFLIKNLQHDWQKGEKYYATKLVDYDVLVNNGNWQWTSSTGADSQPYFRIFNPWTQSKKFDKNCEYIKKWIPELKDVDPKHIHQWDKHHHKYNINYPNPIVDYKQSRTKTLEMYKNVLN